MIAWKLVDLFVVWFCREETVEVVCSKKSLSCMNELMLCEE